MKYIITESKLDEIRTNYLNDRTGSTSTFDNFIIMYYPDDEDGDGTIMMEYDHEDGRLYVDNGFGSSFSDLFFQNDEDAYKFMSEWFENKFDVVVEYTST